MELQELHSYICRQKKPSLKSVDIGKQEETQ